CYLFFFSSRRRHTRFSRDWNSDVCSSDLAAGTDCAVAVGGQLDAHAAFGRHDQCLLQGQADGVLEDDEGFQQHLPARLADGLEHPRKIVLAVDQQLHLIVGTPPGHNSTSTASGAWSDRCDQGRRVSTRASLPLALRRYTRSSGSTGQRAGKLFAGAPCRRVNTSCRPQPARTLSALRRQSLKSPATITTASLGSSPSRPHSRRNCFCRCPSCKP